MGFQLSTCTPYIAGAPLHAIFAHADVVGASMNEQFQARDGLDPDLFSSVVRTFTGHYHKPHTVGRCRLNTSG